MINFIYGLIFNFEKYEIIKVRNSSWMMKKIIIFCKKKNNSLDTKFTSKKNMMTYNSNS